MRTVKVYDEKGNHVDSFKKSVSKEPNTLTYFSQIRIINRAGYYVRRQFSKSGKTLMRVIK